VFSGILEVANGVWVFLGTWFCLRAAGGDKDIKQTVGLLWSRPISYRGTGGGLFFLDMYCKLAW